MKFLQSKVSRLCLKKKTSFALDYFELHFPLSLNNRHAVRTETNFIFYLPSAQGLFAWHKQFANSFVFLSNLDWKFAFKYNTYSFKCFHHGFQLYNGFLRSYLYYLPYFLCTWTKHLYLKQTKNRGNENDDLCLPVSRILLSVLVIYKQTIEV